MSEYVEGVLHGIGFVLGALVIRRLVLRREPPVQMDVVERLRKGGRL